MAESESKYDVLEKIGHGSFGVIRKVRRRQDGMVLCRKEISYLKMSQKEREQLHAEFQILSTLRHPNIVGYYHREHLKATQDLHLYMEYCGNGDLGRVIRELNQKNQFAEESFVWSIFAQLVTALYRCHYGVDPPEVGKNVLGLGSTAKPKVPAGGVTILHRDLKPENVFLGEDNSVKLGDFGLAKMIQSHDFASTYVGTPFYMSPEICAAEKYTLKSDIWSLGCIIYELCAREPPFNAKSHYQLVQKIKEGKVAPLPVVYSPELCTVVRDCLKVNPDRRPDTAMLLNLPVVRLMRKEKEVVELSKALRTEQEQLNRRARELERKSEADKALIRHEIDASMRREWEVKARLEIDRLVNAELDRLQKKFEQEVQARVEVQVQEMEKKMAAAAAAAAAAEEVPTAAAIMGASAPHLPPPAVSPLSSSSVSKSEYNMQSSFNGGDGDGEFPSTTDITELSIDEPMQSTAPASPCATAAPAAAPAPTSFIKRQQNANAPVPQARTPFGRAQTMFAGTPMDVEMASPSPIAIASLSLSPRRNAATKAPTANPGNIFAAAAANEEARWHGGRVPSSVSSDWDSDDDDDVPLPSPTRMIKSRKNPFGAKKPQQPTTTTTASVVAGIPAGRANLPTQRSVPLFGRARSKGPEPALKTASGSAGAGTAVAGGRDRCVSPSRRLSKIPSAASLDVDGSGRGLARQASFTRKDEGGSAGDESAGCGLVSKQKPGIRGRTLVELQQARAGGRPMSLVMDSHSGMSNLSGFSSGSGSNMSPKRAFREHAAAGNRGGLAQESPAVWDPEHDEMPSPFLVRRKTVGRA